jgi:hypothetical protein
MKMAKKKEVKYYELVNKTIVMYEEDVVKLTEEDNKMISFYHNVLGYEICFLKPEEKKKNYFKIEKAEKYILKKDKARIEEFKAIKAEADKLVAQYTALKAKQKVGGKEAPALAEVEAAKKAQINAQRKAYAEQKKWFKETYGQEAYDEVRKM